MSKAEDKSEEIAAALTEMLNSQAKGSALPNGYKVTEVKVERAPGDYYLCKESAGGVLVCKQL